MDESTGAATYGDSGGGSAYNAAADLNAFTGGKRSQLAMAGRYTIPAAASRPEDLSDIRARSEFIDGPLQSGEFWGNAPPPAGGDPSTAAANIRAIRDIPPLVSQEPPPEDTVGEVDNAGTGGTDFIQGNNGDTGTVVAANTTNFSDMGQATTGGPADTLARATGGAGIAALTGDVVNTGGVTGTGGMSLGGTNETMLEGITGGTGTVITGTGSAGGTGVTAGEIRSEDGTDKSQTIGGVRYDKFGNIIRGGR